MKVFSATKMYTQKWLRWQISCYVYFATKKKKRKKKVKSHKLSQSLAKKIDGPGYC